MNTGPRKALSAKMRAFAALYDGNNPKQAAIDAGFKPSNASFMASKLLQDPRIIELVDARLSKKAHVNAMNRRELQDWWSEVIRDESKSMQARLRASEHLGRSLGMFINRVQVSAQVAHTLPPGLTAEELRELARGSIPEAPAVLLPASTSEPESDDDDGAPEDVSSAPH